jgi:osmoprotectant transport system permease protein
LSELWARFPEYLAGHLELSLAALGIGAAIGIPLGVWIARRPKAAPGLLAVVGAAQTIPSLALLAFMVPALAALGALTSRAFGFAPRAIGTGPALAALTLYGVLPILQNTVTGLRGVDPACREAARGVGMTPRQELWRVELPLALPVIVAGLRTAAVWVVGTATLSTPVGAPSLGNYIFSGLQTRNYASVTLGCAAAAGLAFLLDQAIRSIEGSLRRGRRARAVAVAASVLGLASAAALFGAGRVGAAPRTLAIGAKTFTEQYVLSEVLAGWIEESGGPPARILPSLGSTVLYDALRAGDIDVYVDYSGTLWATVLHRSGSPPPRTALLEDVRRGLAADGVVVAAALGFENTYALAMRADRARSLGIASYSDLARRSPELEIGADYEFLVRPEWRSLVSTYGFAFRAARSMDPSLMYQALAQRELDVISAFSTDGRIPALDLVLLRDDRAVIPSYDAVVLVGERLARERPDVVARLGRLEGRIDEASMQRLNRAVDEEGRAPGEVAREWLAAH